MRFETQLIHAGEPRPRPAGAIAMPIYQSSTFEPGAAAGYHDLTYIRLNNTPNHLALHGKLATLEGGEAALVTASGMAAISTTLLAVLSAGDHLLAHDRLYGGATDLLTKDLPRLGITCTFVDARDPAAWAAHVTPRTRAFYVETLTNPLVQIPALAEVARFCRARGLTSIIDNTLATPVLYRPIAHGFDLVVHSATKYLNGHSDIIAGALVGARDDAYWAKLRTLRAQLGTILGQTEAWLLMRGMRTLFPRVAWACRSAEALAERFAAHPMVAEVLYPGLPGFAGHTVAKAQMTGGFSGMLSVRVKGGERAAIATAARVALWKRATSLGGVESLIEHRASIEGPGTPCPTDLLRLSVGVEDTGDLFDDLDQALRRAHNA